MFPYAEVFFCYSELARDLGEKHVIVFSDVEHVILKSMPIALYSNCLARKLRKEQNLNLSLIFFFFLALFGTLKWKASTQLCQAPPSWLS